ncbi:MAG TPA: hypothetical protein DD381_09265 [Lentisphaeria bacterium]|nr:MAG: hypothetical protein A2X47_13540 [Lentisphaerae bacterium GWF2_38_69]HBM16512.1 hypothetical protein [Lentisphaeria bacterium]
MKIFLPFFLLILIVLPFETKAAYQAQWESQVNDAFSQARQSARGLKSGDRAQVNRYLNEAESAWNQAKTQWARQTQLQMQKMNKQMMERQQKMQQQLKQNMQKQMLQNQQKMFKNNQKTLQTIDPFGDYMFHGVSIRPADGRLHGPGTIADDPHLSNLFRKPDANLGRNILDEADNIRSSQEINSGSNKKDLSVQTIKSQWDIPDDIKDYPFAAGENKSRLDMPDDVKDYPFTPEQDKSQMSSNPAAVDLHESKYSMPELLRKDDSLLYGSPIISDESKPNPYASMSSERLEKKKEALTEALKQNLNLMTDNVKGFNNVESDAIAGKEEAVKATADAVMSIAMGYTSLAADRNSERMIHRAIEFQPGADKIEAMRDSVDAIRLSKDVGQVSKAKDTLDLLDYADKGELKEFAEQGALMIGDSIISAPTKFTPSPLYGVTTVTKNTLDTALVWTNYCVLNEEYKRKEMLREQLETNRIKIMNQLNEVRNELKKRQKK